MPDQPQADQREEKGGVSKHIEAGQVQACWRCPAAGTAATMGANKQWRALLAVAVSSRHFSFRLIFRGDS
jgi:hypothetical protein